MLQFKQMKQILRKKLLKEKSTVRRHTVYRLLKN